MRTIVTKTVTGNAVDRERARWIDHQGYTLIELLIALAMVGLIMAGVATAYSVGSAMYLTGSNQAQAQQDTRVALMMLEEDLRLIGYGYPTDATLPKITNVTSTSTNVSITFWADLASASTVLASGVASGATTLTVPTPTSIVAGDNIYLINGAQWERRLVTAVTAGTPNTTITVGAATSQYQTCPCSFPQGAQVGRAKLIAHAWNQGTGTITRDIGDGNGPQTLVTGVQTFALTYLDANGNTTTTAANIRQVMIDMAIQLASYFDGGTAKITSDIRPRNL